MHCVYIMGNRQVDHDVWEEKLLELFERLFSEQQVSQGRSSFCPFVD